MSSSSLFTAHDVPDLIGALPTRFGFVPEESVCVIATSGPRCRLGFSLRLDLPDAHSIVPAAEHVVGHLRRQDAEGAIIIAVSQRPELAGPAVWAVEQALGDIAPVVSAWATTTRYWTTFHDCDPEGYPYEPSPHHRAVVAAIAAGQEILPDRAALERRFQPEQSARRRWLERTVDGVALDAARQIAVADAPAVEVGRRVLEPVLERALLGQTPTDGEVLQLAVWVTTLPVRDFVWGWINRETAHDMLALWAHVARLAPVGLAAGPLCLAALAAYLRGDGAQALIAAERARDLEPHYTLASLVIDALERGISPQEMGRVSDQLRADDDA
ncbi:DUF4192 domain-containing protein [Aeromicrobium sp. CF4.19]|uniref:DUF4192 domain-containing protein n=1 Tax=Aeromicrobium sp. CF4.19 TaxID=3373082 RepID=UPI003EE5495E